MKKIIATMALFICFYSLFSFSACTSKESNGIDDLEQRIIALETQIENSTNLKSELDKLKQTISSFAEDNETSQQINDLLVRIAALETKVEAANNHNAKYEKLYLSSINFSSYISICPYFGDITVIETGLVENPYRLFANYYIETYACKPNIYFENVEILYAISIPTLDEYYPSPSIQLSNNGYSKCSVGTAKFSSSLADCYPSSDLDYITIVSVSGYVYIPKEG